MAIAASRLHIHPGNAARVGVTIGSGIGGFEVIEREHQVLLTRGPERVSRFFIVAAPVNLAAGQVAVRFGAKGPNSVIRSINEFPTALFEFASPRGRRAPRLALSVDLNRGDWSRRSA
jgi:beta-ketoacyl synthase-like protein